MDIAETPNRNASTDWEREMDEREERSKIYPNHNDGKPLWGSTAGYTVEDVMNQAVDASNGF